MRARRDTALQRGVDFRALDRVATRALRVEESRLGQLYALDDGCQDDGATAIYVPPALDHYEDTIVIDDPEACR